MTRAIAKRSKAGRPPASGRSAPERPAATQAPRAHRGRLHPKHRDFVEQIAAIFVAAGETASLAAERVREQIPQLATFNDITFHRWRGNGEWLAALAAARDEARFDEELRQQLRGKKFLRWATARMESLVTEHASAVEGQDGKKAQALEGRILKLNDALRAEEKYQGELRRVSGPASPLTVTVTFAGGEDEAAETPAAETRQ